MDTYNSLQYRGSRKEGKVVFLECLLGSKYCVFFFALYLSCIIFTTLLEEQYNFPLISENESRDVQLGLRVLIKAAFVWFKSFGFLHRLPTPDLPKGLGLPPFLWTWYADG